MAKSDSVQPVAPRDRIVALDVLRGFAMLGVLVAYCVWSLGTTPEESWSRLDRSLGVLVNFAVDGKFYTILAFLFGLGFSLQLERTADGQAAVRTYRRRLAVLAAIGLGHALLLRNGDILLPYALTGFVLVPFRRASDRIIVATAIAALLLPYAARWAWQASGVPIPDRPQLEDAPYLVENAAWVRYWFETAIFTWPTNLTLFLFGFLAGRHRLVARLAGQPRTLATILIGGLLGATALFWITLNLTASMVVPGLVFTVQNWCLSSAYAAALLLALRSRAGAALVAPLAPVGRMALTNYLLQAAIIVPLCLIFGWFDTFTPTRAFALAFALAIVQLPFSAWWLSRYRFGPAEWVWRLFTYGRVPPLKLDRGDYAPV
ncbi:MAG TPA: DUF418 domain-containing protein [Sphingomicrobium sp.]